MKVTIDAVSSAKLVHRYLAKWEFRKYSSYTQKILYKKRGYKIQWQNIKYDISILWQKTVLQPELGAVSFDAAGSTSSPGATSLSYNHTCSGTNRTLVAGLVVDANGVSGTATYAQVSMTKVSEVDNTKSSEMYALSRPKLGANSLAISHDASSTEMCIGGVSFNGSSGTVNNAANNAGNSTTPSVTVTSATDNMVIDVMMFPDDSVGSLVATADASQIERVDLNSGGTSAVHIGMSTEAGAASVGMDWSCTGLGSQPWAINGAQVVAGTQTPDAVIQANYY